LVIDQHGVVAVIVRDGRFLVIRRSPHVVAPGALCFPGGGIEKGETEQAALIRELDEELDIAIHPVGRIWESVTPWRVRISWWRARLPLSSEPRPNDLEVAAVYWMAIDELYEHQDLLSSNAEFLQAIRSGQIVLDEVA